MYIIIQQLILPNNINKKIIKKLYTKIHILNTRCIIIIIIIKRI